jgi:hypothetical protein
VIQTTIPATTDTPHDERPLYEHAENLGQPLPAAVVAQLQDEAEVRRWIAESREAARHGDLDPTPVDDLEAWHADNDPCATADLAARLDEAFGPLDEIDWAKR